MAPLSVVGVTGTISTLKTVNTMQTLKGTRIVRIARIDKIATCATRERIHDLAVLLFGIGLGVLLYALLHDLVLVLLSRRAREDDVQECAPGCMCEPLPVYREKEDDAELALPRAP